jgi:hypothetical protein
MIKTDKDHAASTMSTSALPNIPLSDRGQSLPSDIHTISRRRTTYLARVQCLNPYALARTYTLSADVDGPFHSLVQMSAVPQFACYQLEVLPTLQLQLLYEKMDHFRHVRLTNGRS